MSEFVANLKQMWHRIAVGARDTSQSAGAYVERQRHVMALRAEVREAEGQRSKLYGQMGRKVYALHRKGKVANKDLLRTCQEIDELNTLIEAKNTRIEALLATPEEQEVEIADESELPEVGEAEPELSEEAAEAEQAKQ